MDIHKPKPWRGVREFLKEYLIIVIGVLTALAAEQGVEWLHWRQVVGEARHELTLDQSRLVGRIGSIQGQSPCKAQRLDELSAILDRAAKTGRLPAVGEFSGSGTLPWSLRSWSTLVSGGALPHFPRGEADRYSAEALYLDSIPPRQQQEGDAWLALRAMIGPGRPLSEAEAVSLRGALMLAYRQAGIMRRNADQLAELVRDTHLLSDKDFAEAWRYGVDRAKDSPLCQPIQPGGDPYAGFRKGATAPLALPQASYDDPAHPYATRAFRRR